MDQQPQSQPQPQPQAPVPPTAPPVVLPQVVLPAAAAVNEVPPTPPEAASAPAVPVEPIQPTEPELPAEPTGEESSDELEEEEPDESGPFAEDGEELEEPLSWQATEYVHHQKGATWYVGLAVVVIILCIAAAFFHYWLGIAVFIAMGIAIVVYAQKPPRILTYSLDADSVTIEDKSYPYSNFRSFAVLSDTEWHAIDLEPTGRFMPRLTVLFSDDDFDAITDHLALHLPRVDRAPDIIERASRYFRF